MDQILIALAGIMGAAGIMLTAAGAHGKPGVGLDSAGYLLLIHAVAVIAGTVAARSGLILRPLGIIVICGFVLGAALFAADVAARAYLGGRLFPFAAPTGGIILIISWLALTAAALAALRGDRASFAERRRPLKERHHHAKAEAMSKAPKIDPQKQARILSEALPHMQRYDEEIVVVKYGGHAMGQEQTARDFARDVVLLEQTAINPVVVHGGGPQIEAMLKKLGIKSEFAAGLRITDEKTVEIVEMVLAGSINKQIVGYINAAGGKAIGLCGKDGNMVQARKVTRTVVDPGSNIEKVVDLGFVGEPDKVDVTMLNEVIGRELIPVLAPVATSATGGTFNVNADTFAGAIAGALKAKRLLLLTDVPGVLDKSKKLIEALSVADARKLIADGTISGGMIPKVETCIYALDQGVEGVVIMDGKVPHAVLLELLTDHGVGTLMHR